MEYRARNTNHLAPAVYADLAAHGIRRDSRNGPVLYFDEPVTVILERPWERVNRTPHRAANPFFHLWEALAMLGGRNSVSLLKFFARNMSSFTDDGLRYNAFYGERLRATWGDQLDTVIRTLATDPDSRQAVAQIWDPADLLRQTKDKACNMSLVFAVDSLGRLKMTSYNRSNDAIWGGVTGANVVHLSFFQEYVACALGRPMGEWAHVSANLHVYVDNPKWAALRDWASPRPSSYFEEYPADDLERSPALFAPEGRAAFDAELSWCLTRAEAAAVGHLEELTRTHLRSEFLREVAVPMLNAWINYRRDGNSYGALQCVGVLPSRNDWRAACEEWLHAASARVGGAAQLQLPLK